MFMSLYVFMKSPRWSRTPVFTETPSADPAGPHPVCADLAVPWEQPAVALACSGDWVERGELWGKSKDGGSPFSGRLPQMVSQVSAPALQVGVWFLLPHQ